jgi:hypothetical protein
MIALLHIFLLTFNQPKERILKRDYISYNLQLHNITTYSIDNEIDYDDIMCINYHAKDLEEFFSYLDIIGVQYSKSNDYYIFTKKTND